MGLFSRFNKVVGIQGLYVGAVGSEQIIADASGNLTGAVTGDITGDVTGLALQGGSATAIAADGAIPITTLYSSLDSSGGALAMTLADGVAGQMKVIKCDTAGNDAVVTPANFKDGTTITLDAANESVLLVFDGTDWCVVGTATATVA